MKIHYSLFFILIISFSDSFAQTWSVQQQGISKGFVREMYFIDANTGYATSSDIISTFSPIYKTTNGGNNWTYYLTTCTGALYGVAFTNATTGYVSSFNGEVAKTTNGGVNWVEVYQNGSGFDLAGGILFFDANTGFASGQGYYVRTTNAGSSWSEVSGTGNTGTCTDIINSTTAVYAGYNVSINGTVFKTTNSGASFTSQIVFGSVSTSLYGVHFFDLNNGYCGGQGGILAKTTNGGSSWTPLTYPVAQNIYGMHFFDANTGLIGGGAGALYRTTNGGTNFTAVTMTPATSQSIYSFHFFNSSNGIMSGSNGTYYRTTDGGLTWNVISINTQLNGVTFIDSQTGFVVGNSGMIQKTVNGGTNWSVINSPTNVNLNNIVFPNSTTGYINAVSGKFLRSTNTGTTWDSLSTGTTLSMVSMEFIDVNTGYVGSTNGIVKKTTNGGLNWTDYNVGASITSNGISFPNVNTGFVCASSGVIRKTTNAGVNWSLLTTGTAQGLLSIDFFDANTGYAAGNAGTLIKTTNGGTNWTLQTTGVTDNINSIKFGSVTRGMCALNTGKILVTTDGGANWSQQTSNVASNINLRGAFIQNGNNLYIVGQNGSILNSTDQVLPVELASFTSTVQNNRDVRLNWQTVTETNNSGFEIERTVKAENEQWIKIGFVTGNGTTNNQQSYAFEDKNLSAGTYKYRLKQIDYNGNYEYKNLISEVIIGKPNSFELSQNYPNPFNPATKIVFSLPFDSKVTLKIFDITGKEIRTLLNDFKSADFYTVDFNASELPSGIYFCKISAQSDSKDFAKTIKMILSK